MYGLLMRLVIALIHTSLVRGTFSRVSLKHTHFLRNYTSLMMEKETLCEPLKKSMSEWQFSELKLLQLPLDEIKENYVRRNVQNAVFSEVSPTPLREGLKLVAYSKDALVNILDMDPSITETQEFVEFIAGARVLDSSIPLAHRYGGHQFGVWAMQLGDGRAHLLGEYINRKGEHWELQLKGSGMTPYSRSGDGRAVLRSSIREFLCSEAMYYLGIPTSRAAAVVVSRDPVERDQFYNGFPQQERAAIVLRLAPSWFRFGSLEILARQHEIETLRQLVDYIIQEHYPYIEGKNKYLRLFAEVAHKTVDLAVMWQCVGFTHGVLNTDNMSLLNVTIDYGPFGFVEAYHPRFVPNSSDGEGRYCYSKQIEVVLWNLEKLVQALSPLLEEVDRGELLEIYYSLEGYANFKLSQGFRRKLGLTKDMPGDMQLVDKLLRLMELTETDFTMVFRQLGEVSLEELVDPEATKGLWALEKLQSHKDFEDFVMAYSMRITAETGCFTSH
ncbi:protein adenylyltransferase SelO isoform X2 [Anabrus simplex]|uniref:protein adenylyltransferase SelO isoform X2 n=1 Tax=Anabrus simplex TaxID=316456 RepID=UPI0035A3A496